MIPDSRESTLGYEPRPQPPRRPDALHCVIAGMVVTGFHAFLGIVYWPVKFAIDHHTIWLSQVTDWLSPMLLPLPSAGMALAMSQGMRGQDETRMLITLSLLNSLLYGLLGAFVYRRLGRQR